MIYHICPYLLKRWWYHVSPNLYSIIQCLVCALYLYIPVFHACKTCLKFVHPKVSGQSLKSKHATGPPGPQKPRSYPKACFSITLFFIAPRGLNLVLTVKRGQKVKIRYEQMVNFLRKIHPLRLSWIWPKISYGEKFMLQNGGFWSNPYFHWKKLRSARLRIRRRLKYIWRN